MLIKQIYDPYLSQYAYLIGCPKSGEALIIDAQRDVDRYIDLAEANGLKITAAAETHIHADFLGGVRQLVEQVGGVQGYLSKMGGEDWQYQWAQDHKRVNLLKDGDSFAIGNVHIAALHHPGHTPEHLSFLIEDTSSEADIPFALVSGDFMFVGDVGRPDLLEEAAGETGTRESSAEALYESIQQFGDLDDFVVVLPGHGAGSSCGKALGSIPFSTVGYEKRSNSSVKTALAGKKDAFIEDILEGQPAPAMYFARMKNLNRDGVPLYDSLPCPPKLEASAFTQQVADGGGDEVVVLDLRADREAFMRKHWQGALYAPFGAKFTEAAGSYVKPDTKIYLMLEKPEQIEDCVRQLIRIGLDQVCGCALVTDILEDPACNPFLRQIKTITTTEIDPDQDTVLDVRSAEEYAEAHVPGAINLPHTRIVADAEELPAKTERLTVHCGSGVRTALASAALERMGYQVTFADGKFENWKAQADEVAEG